MPVFTAIFCVVVILAFVSLGEGSAFLRPHAAQDSAEAARQRVVEGLLGELSIFHQPSLLRDLEEELRPLFAVLPQDADGTLTPSIARYALHRHFAQRRGWHMKGMEFGASELNSTAAGVVEIFGKGQGIDLEKFALLVSMLTDIVHKEAENNLRNVYAGLGLSTDSVIRRKDAEVALQRYLVMYLLGDSTEGLTRDDMLEAEKDVVDTYPAWRSVKMWSKDLDQTLQLTEQTRNPFFGKHVPFEQSLSTVQQLGHRFATFQNLECRSLKGALMDIEWQGTGRVLLSDFYRVGLNEDWQFNENPQELRSLGALDDSNPERLSVVIPNYVYSQTNCLSSSGFYSVCCFNECEGLLRSLERHFGEPSARPSDIAEKVALLASDTVAASRNLSSALQLRLAQIAELHGGRVMMHGRLFAQWLHQVYPRECPFPQFTGSTSPPSQEEGLGSMSGEVPLAKDGFGLQVSSQQEAPEQDVLSLPWIEMQELVPSQPTKPRTPWILWQSVVAITALASVAFPFVHGKKAMGGEKPGFATQRYLV